MGQAKVKAARRAAKEKPEELGLTEEQSHDNEKKFATKSSLGEPSGYEEVELPYLGEWVRVRYLGTAEIARLQFLPDLANSAELLSNTNVEDLDEEGPSPASGDFVAATLDYLASVAHLAILDPGEGDSPRKCPDCKMVHIPSLWTRRQCALLKQPDTEKVSEVALQTSMMKVVGPFSEDKTQEDSPPPVDSGESTPQTS